jgi:hypothetical protein
MSTGASGMLGLLATLVRTGFVSGVTQALGVFALD